MRMDTTRADMTQAVLEGVAFAFRECTDIARAQGIEIKVSTVCGGGAKSPLWCRILANVLNIRLVKPETEQGPGYGGAMLAAAACGEYESVRECASRIFHEKEVIDPEPELVEKYEKQYQKWKKLYPLLKDTFREINE